MNGKKKEELDQDELLAIEAMFLRIHQSPVANPKAPLEKKSNDPKLLNKLLQIEQKIMRKARQKGII